MLAGGTDDQDKILASVDLYEQQVHLGRSLGARGQLELHPDSIGRRDKWLHDPDHVRIFPDMNRRFFLDESKKKLWRPCREARALGL